MAKGGGQQHLANMSFVSNRFGWPMISMVQEWANVRVIQDDCDDDDKEQAATNTTAASEKPRNTTDVSAFSLMKANVI